MNTVTAGVVIIILFLVPFLISIKMARSYAPINNVTKIMLFLSTIVTLILLALVTWKSDNKKYNLILTVILTFLQAMFFIILAANLERNFVISEETKFDYGNSLSFYYIAYGIYILQLIIQLAFLIIYFE